MQGLYVSHSWQAVSVHGDWDTEDTVTQTYGKQSTNAAAGATNSCPAIALSICIKAEPQCPAVSLQLANVMSQVEMPAFCLRLYLHLD